MTQDNLNRMVDALFLKPFYIDASQIKICEELTSDIVHCGFEKIKINKH